MIFEQPNSFLLAWQIITLVLTAGLTLSICLVLMSVYSTFWDQNVYWFWTVGFKLQSHDSIWNLGSYSELGPFTRFYSFIVPLLWSIQALNHLRIRDIDLCLHTSWHNAFPGLVDWFLLLLSLFTLKLAHLTWQRHDSGWNRTCFYQLWTLEIPTFSQVYSGSSLPISSF